MLGQSYQACMVYQYLSALQRVYPVHPSPRAESYRNFLVSAFDLQIYPFCGTAALCR